MSTLLLSLGLLTEGVFGFISFQENNFHLNTDENENETNKAIQQKNLQRNTKNNVQRSLLGLHPLELICNW